MIKKLSFKTLSLLVTFAIILSAVFVAVSPVMAEKSDKLVLAKFDNLVVSKGAANLIKESATEVNVAGSQVKGFKVTADQLNATPENNLIETKCPLVMSGFDVPLNNMSQMVFYVKIPSANILNFTLGINANHYKYSWSPTLYNNVGDKYKVLAKGSDKWEEKTFVEGYEGKTYYGSMKFDAAFEGYVMFEMDPMFETEFVLLREIDKLNSIAVRFQKIGGNYGEMTVAPMLASEDNGSSDFEVKYTVSELSKKDETYKPSYETADRNELKSYTVLNVTRPYSHPDYNLSRSLINTLDFTTETGYELSYSEKLHQEDLNTLKSSKVYLATDINSNNSMANTTGIAFYISVPDKTVIAPTFGIKDPGNDRWKHPDWGGPLLSPIVGSEYWVLEDGSNEWVTKQFVETEEGNTGMAGLGFDKAFSGIIRIPYSALMNDSGFKLDITLDSIASSAFRLQDIGPDFKIKIAPLMLSKSVGTANREDIKTFTPIKMATYNPIGINNHSKVNPLDFTTENGYLLSTNADVTIETDVSHKAKQILVLNAEEQSLAGTDGLLLYVSLPKATQIALTYNARISGTSREYSPNEGLEYQVLADGSNVWETKTVVKGQSKWPNIQGAFQFDSAFTGYIKIPWTSLKGDHKKEMNLNTDIIENFAIRFKNMGPSFGEVTVGPILLTKPVEKKHGEYPETDPEKLVDYLFESSKKKLIRDVNYFMVGDSTRDGFGQIVFRRVKYVMENEYNVTAHLHAKSGLKAEHWSGYTPGLQGDSQPVVEQLIEKIPGDGYNCIVDISLGINDTGTNSGAKTAEFIEMAIEKIKAAKPYTVFVYTTPNLVGSTSWQESLDENNEIFRNKNDKYAIVDVAKGALDVYDGDYYIDFIHPNTAGQRIVAEYIISTYFPQYTYTKPISPATGKDAIKISQPADTTFIKGGFSYKTHSNLNATPVLAYVDDVVDNAIKVTSTKDLTSEYVFEAKNYIEINNFKTPLTNLDYMILHIKLPAANQIGFTTHTDNGKTENILVANASYYVMADGATAWTEKTTSLGRKGNETYGSMVFDGAFSGFVKIPIKKLHRSNGSDTVFSSMTLRFAKIGPEYGAVSVGPFFTALDKPYEASNVWKLGDLPEYTPYTAITKTKSYSGVSRFLINSPVPTLSKEKAARIESLAGCDYDELTVHRSIHWLSTEYDNFKIDNGTHVMFYVKAPQDKDSYLVMSLFGADHYEFKIFSQSPYSLMPLGSTEWQHFTTVDGPMSHQGSIYLPAGFEGIVKVPYTSYTPLKINSDTVITDVTYRFSYIGTDNNGIIVGPLMNVTKDNDAGPGEVVLTKMPAATTTRFIYKPDKTDIFKDKVMLYWQSLTGAKDYVVTAYRIDETEDGFLYTEVSSAVFYSNSGTIGGLEPGTKYAINVQARGDKKALLAIYDFITVTTIKDELYEWVGVETDIVKDSVYYKNFSAKTANIGLLSGGLPLVIGIIVLAAAVIAGGVLFIILFVRKRRNNG